MRGSLAALDDNAAIAELASGALTHQIAARYGVPKETLRDRLKKHPNYQQAVRDQAESLVEQATQESLEVAAEMPLIARARLRVDSAHKWAAARDPGTWGAKPELAQALTINIAAAGDVVAVALQSEVPTNPNDRELVIMSNPARAQGVAAAQRAKHIARLASMTPEQLAALVALADRALPEPIASTPTRSPVPPRLVDSEGDK